MDGLKASALDEQEVPLVLIYFFVSVIISIIQKIHFKLRRRGGPQKVTLGYRIFLLRGGFEKCENQNSNFKITKIRVNFLFFLNR